MDKLKERFQSCEAALATLAEAISLPFSVIVRDAAIQRFEYSFEATWKLLKHYLEQQEGVRCGSPKSCFREGLQAKLLAVEETELCLAMVDDRNLTSHTYHEALAAALYTRLPNYVSVMQVLVARIAAQLPQLRDE